MSSIQERIVALVDEECGGNRSEFARRINISPAFVAQIYSGIRTPSDRTLSDIVREFQVNGVWLRTGEGERFQDESRKEQIMRFATQTVKGSDEFRKSFVAMLAQMDADDWEVLSKIFKKLSGEIKKTE